MANLITLHETFHKVLHHADKELYYKWLFGCDAFTNAEKDQLAICSRIARKMIESK